MSQMTAKVKIAIVDDHPILREGISHLLLENHVAEDVAAFSTAEEFLSALEQGVNIDVCLLDIALPGMGGFEALHELTNRFPNVKVIVLTAQPATAVAVRSLRAGAKGFISKGQDPRSVFAAIDTVVGGGRAIDPEYLDLVLSAVDDGTERLPHESLSNREYEIMMRLAEGQALQSIAEDLNISPKTVSTYRRRTLEKMGFSRNSQLTEYVLRYLRPPS
ncbi:MAG: hypothetical protein RLZZ31_1592 [Actinomycetota bacterium]